MEVKVEVDTRALIRSLERLSTRDAKSAMNRAVTRAATSVRKEAARLAREDYEVKSKAVKANVSATRSTQDRFTADVRITGGLISLRQYGRPKQVKRGVQVTVRRGAGRTLYPRAFLAETAAGSHVYWRTKGAGPTGLVGRGPIEVLWGPAISSVLKQPARAQKLLDVASSRVQEVLQQELKYRLNTPPGARRGARRRGGK